MERLSVDHAFREAIVGAPQTVKAGLRAFIARTQVDELMVTAAIHDPAAKAYSFKLVAEARVSLGE
jgi:alkanesulfonate monooxygenase SsuD/methylene tetrahydromethanopterin reductase-like flavin-dependent oxidoreductase (luciferase family)